MLKPQLLLFLLVVLIFTGCNRNNDAVNPNKVNDTSKYVFSVFAGSSQGNADGKGTSAKFNMPFGAALDIDGNLIVTDEFNNSLRKITPEGQVSTLSSVSGTKDVDGNLKDAFFYEPLSIASDGLGNIFVIDLGLKGGKSHLRKIDKSGIVTSIPIIFNGIQLDTQQSTLAVDKSGNIYIDDYINHDIKKLSPSGMVSSISFPTFALFPNIVSGMAFDSNNNLFITDANDARVFKVKPDGTISLFSTSYSVTVNNITTQVNYISPSSIVIDKHDNLFIADWESIRMITPQGIASTVIANCFPDGLFNNYYHMNAIDANGNIYLPDPSDNTIGKILVQH